MSEATSQLVTAGTTTIFGANGKVLCTGTAYWTDADTQSLQFTHSGTVVEQRNGLGNVRGVAAADARIDGTLVFYPLPATADAAGYRALELPNLLDLITVAEGPAATGAVVGVLPTAVKKTDYLYMGGGSMAFTQDGLAVWTLPVRKYTSGAFGT